MPENKKLKLGGYKEGNMTVYVLRLTCFRVNTEGGFQQVVHPLGDGDIQAGVGKLQHYLLEKVNNISAQKTFQLNIFFFFLAKMNIKE